MLIMLLFRKVAGYSSAPEISETFRQARAANACLAVALQRGDDMHTLHLTTNKTRQRTKRGHRQLHTDLLVQGISSGK